MEPCQAGGKQTKHSDRTSSLEQDPSRTFSQEKRIIKSTKSLLLLLHSLASSKQQKACLRDTCIHFVSWNGGWLLTRRRGFSHATACEKTGGNSSLFRNDKCQRKRRRESVFKRFSHSLMLFITSQQLQRGAAACNCGHRSFGPETTNQDRFLFPLRRLTVSESSDLEMGHYLTWTRSDVKEH